MKKKHKCKHKLSLNWNLMQLHSNLILLYSIFKVFFYMDHFKWLYWICSNIVSALCFGFFGCKACELLAPRPGIESMPPALEGEVLTPGPPEKSYNPILKKIEAGSIWVWYLNAPCSIRRAGVRHGTSTTWFLLSVSGLVMSDSLQPYGL